MTDETFEQSEKKQDPATAIPVATIYVVIELLEAIKETSPALSNRVNQRLQSLVASDALNKYPRSKDLIEVLCKEVLGSKK